MLATDGLQKVSPPSSLEEIMAILSIEYEEDLTSLAKAPHHWLIIKDAATGVMGGLCLTPRDSVPSHPMLADFCRNVKNGQSWVASHLFCWLPQHLDEDDVEAVQHAVKSFFAQLYSQLVELSMVMQ